MRVILTGGGTGGHIFPAIAISQAIIKRDHSHQIRYVGSSDGMEAKIAPDVGLEFTGITARKLHKVISLETILVLLSLLNGYREACAILESFQPDAVVGTGGYVAAAVILAAVKKGAPTIIVEENAIPGRTNLWLARWATKTCVGFDMVQKEFPANKTQLTGVPIRGDILSEMPKTEARRELGLVPDRFTILILGGSQGAQKLNEVVAEMAAKTNLPLQFLHQVGEKNMEDFQSRWEISLQANTIVRHQSIPFMSHRQITLAYRSTDMVICRCGASTLAEITACGLPSLMVPLPTAYADHQTANASAVAKEGAGILLPQGNLTPNLLEQKIKLLYEDRVRLAELANASKMMGRPMAAKTIADIALGLKH